MHLQTLLPLPVTLLTILIFFIWYDLYLVGDSIFSSYTTALDNIDSLPRGKYTAKRISRDVVLIVPKHTWEIKTQCFLIPSSQFNDLPISSSQELIKI